MNRARSFGPPAFALIVGLALLIVTLRQTNWQALGSLTRSLGWRVPLLFLPSAAWHLLRTAALRECFPRSAAPSFGRLWRVRLAAEAFSFVTIRGVAGEPLKVVLLNRDVDATVAAAAIALERLTYIVVTAAIVALGSIGAMALLPLSGGWFRVFAASAVLGVAVSIVPLVLLRRSTPREVMSDETSRTGWRAGLSRAIAIFQGQARALTTTDPQRLFRLITLQTLVYLTMAVEVWLVMRLTRTPISAIEAVAVETFTRVASFVSAAVPGNIGTLEAANVAVARAMDISAVGAIALALARRARGLFWCLAGFAIYPRQARVRHVVPAVRGVDAAGLSDVGVLAGHDLALVESRSPEVDLHAPLGGLPMAERIVRAAIRAGYTRILVWTPARAAVWTVLASRFAHRIAVVATGDATSWRAQIESLGPRGTITVVGDGVVPSPALLAAAAAMPPPDARAVVEVPAGPEWPRSGVFVARLPELYHPAAFAFMLAPPPDAPEPPVKAIQSGSALLSLQLPTIAALPAAEYRLRQSVFKTTDGRLGSFNRRISLPISVALIRWMRLSPHAMSVLVMALGFVAGWLFSDGRYLTGVAAAAISWAASVLDGCDGELARLQYRESNFGCWLDTWGDYTYYIAIFAGLTVGAVHQTGWPGYWWIGGALLAGTVATLGLLVMLRQRITGTRPELLRTNAKAHFYGTGKPWARVVAKLSTVATRATAPYGILALAILGLLPVVVILAAVGAQIYWISITVELKRLLDGSRQSPYPPQRRADTPLTSA